MPQSVDRDNSNSQDADHGNEPTPEIKELIEQFAGHWTMPEEQEGTRPAGRVSFAEHPAMFPPRKSSLQPFHASATPHTQELETAHRSANQDGNPLEDDNVHEASRKDKGDGLPSPSKIYEENTLTPGSPRNTVPSASLEKSLPPSDPESDLPFDFHRFLEQLRHRTADPVAKFLRSFLTEFGKKQWMVHEQVKIVSDFLAFIAGKMAQCEVWRDASDAEFENAKEGMEKLVMNRLYSQTFSPAIPPARSTALTKGGKAVNKQPGPGRRGQHQEDVERDEVLAQKIRIYRWTREDHLEIPPIDEQGKRFLNLAQQGT